MSARRPGGRMPALLGLVALFALIGLLLLDGERSPVSQRERPAAVPDRAPVRPPRPANSGTAGRPAGDEPAGSVDGEAPPAVPDTGYRLTVEVRFEDGTPYPGASFLEMECGEDGSPDIYLDSEMEGGTDSPKDGVYTLGWDRRPSEILLLVMSEEVEFLSASGGGELVEPGIRRVQLRAGGGGRPVVRVRWRPGWALVRVLDRETGEPIDERVSADMRWRRPDGNIEGASHGQSGRPGEYEVRPPSTLSEEDAKSAVLEVFAKGRETVRVPIDEVRGALDVRLGPGVPDVIAALERPAASSGPVGLTWGCQPIKAGTWGADHVRGSVSLHEGVRLYDVPEGRWTLAVTSYSKEGVRWAQRTFDKAAEPVDLGRLSFTASSSIRARVVDADGKPMRRPLMVAPLMAREHGVRFFNVAEEPGEPEGQVVSLIGTDFSPVEDLVDGWMLFAHLGPGLRYRVSAPWPYEAALEFEAPAEPGATKVVEIRLAHRPVKGILRFTVEGEPPAEWGSVVSGPLGSNLGGDGTWEGEIYPGECQVAVEARKRRTSDLKRYEAFVQIPVKGPFDLTVDLK